MEQVRVRKLKIQDGKVVLENDVSVYGPEISLSEIKKGDVFSKVGAPGLFMVTDAAASGLAVEPVRILEDGRISGGDQENDFLEGRIKTGVSEISSQTRTLHIHQCGIVMAQQVVRCPGCSEITIPEQWRSIEVYVSGE